MALSVLLVLVGLALLVAGGELLVRAASRIAALAGVSPAVIGLTVVAAGTSTPELVVSLQSALEGRDDIALGNVVGSNTFNVGMILGVAALLAPLKIVGQSVRLEWPLVFLVSCLLYLLARDGAVDRVEGGFFLAAFVAFLTYMVRTARRDVTGAEAAEFDAEVAARGGAARRWGPEVARVLAGLALLVVGAELLVTGAVDLARAAGISEAVIGVTVVAAGTSLPELAASAVAALRGRADVAVTNVLGSNVFNVLAILGTSACVTPLAVTDEMLGRDLLWMIGLAALLFPLMLSGRRVTRLEGAVLLAAWGGYLAVLLGA